MTSKGFLATVLALAVLLACGNVDAHGALSGLGGPYRIGFVDWCVAGQVNRKEGVR